MKVLIIVVYFLSFVPHWYLDKWSVISAEERPSLINGPNKQISCMILNAVLRYGLALGVWYLWGLYWALGALAIHYFIGWRLSKHYVQRALKHYTDLYRLAHGDAGIDEDTLRKDATWFAVRMVHLHTEGKPPTE